MSRGVRTRLPLRGLALAAASATLLALGVASSHALRGERSTLGPVTTGATRDRQAQTSQPAPRPPEPAPVVVVGRFTTHFTAGEPRVINIRRAARLLDGAVIPAGATMSLNEALGERTTARGFVAAPMISGGRLVDSVGGGISQVATTLYNAAFLAGLELVEHRPHSFWIDRYPMGREATISWGGPELVIRNDWPAAVELRARTTATSITIALRSERLGRRIESWTGRPYAYTPPTTVTVATPSRPIGEAVLVQPAGASGFTVEYGRRVYRHERERRDERFRVTYLAKNAIVEVGTGARGGR